MIVCPITSAKDMDVELRMALEKRPDFLEFRTDLLPLEKWDEVRAFANENGFGIVLTIKDLTLPSNRLLIQRADFEGVSYIDLDYVELKNDGLSPRFLRLLSSRPIRLMISHHIFEEEREDCEGIGERMDLLEDCRAEIISGFGFRRVLIKFAYHVRDEAEAEAFCRLSSERKDFVVVPMGDFGKNARLKLCGINPLSYAYLRTPNAPGQPSVEEYATV